MKLWNEPMNGRVMEEEIVSLQWSKEISFI